MKQSFQQAREACLNLVRQIDEAYAKRAEIEANENPADLLKRPPSGKEIDSACMYMRHDYGLMSLMERDKLRYEATEWLKAWAKVEEDGENLSFEEVK